MTGARWPPAPRCTNARSRTRRLAPLRNVFTLPHLPVAGRPRPAAPRLPGCWPASAPATTSATRGRRSGTTSTASWPRTASTRRRPGDDAGPRPRARLRVQPADRLLVPPARRHAGLRGGRGAQHLRPAARLPAAPRRARPGRGAEGVLRLAVLPGRRLLPDEPARAGRHASRSPSRCTARTGTRSWPACTAGPCRPPRGPARAAARHPWSTAAVSARIRWQGIRLYLRGLPVDPAASPPAPRRESQ